ncbi:hypothetical protein AgCh_004512 [Apium graveolens]
MTGDERQYDINDVRRTIADDLLHLQRVFHATYKEKIGVIPFLMADKADIVMPLGVTQTTPKNEVFEPGKNNEDMTHTLELMKPTPGLLSI